MLLNIIVIIVTVSYLFVIISFIAGWSNIKVVGEGSQSPFPVFMSVIIAARNEEHNIINTLNSISSQTLNEKYFEVLIIDDFSSDNTSSLVKQFCDEHANFQLIKLSEHKGKKYALNYGIKKAKAELIVTTDADCEFYSKWLQIINNYYVNNYVEMIIGPVLFKSRNSFEHMQALDFFSLMVSGAAATGINKPIMNNGANLAFSKKTYLKFTDATLKKVSSGDDVFLLLKMKEKFPEKIHFLKSRNAIVYTKAQKTLSGFINQRKRWASKSKHYNDFDIIYTAFAVLMINILMFSTFIASILSVRLLFLFAFMFIVKSVFDFIFLFKTTRFFQQQFLLKYFLLTQLANIFFIPLLAFAGLFTNTSWKGKIVSK